MKKVTFLAVVLPAVVFAGVWTNLEHLFPISHNIPSEVTVSDKTAKIAELNSFKVLDNNDNEIGEIIYASMEENNGGVLVSWIY